MLADDPPYLSVGTEVSAKYKGAFCEAKIRKVVRSVKCRVTYKQGLGTATVTDDQIKGTLRVGASVEARHVDKKDFVDATITKIQDCSQYTVVFDDGDITTLRRTALCLKSGRHFAESETLDQLPLTHPEHFGNPVIGGRRGRRSRQAQDDSSEDEESPPRRSPSGAGPSKEGPETEPEIGRVVCVELGDKKKKDNWFPGLVVAPTAQDTVRIRVRDDYLVRSFKDARYYTVPKKEATEFTKEFSSKVENSTLKLAVEKALLFLEKNELPPHWDRDSLFGNTMSSGNSDTDPELESDSSDDEPREEKDHFVAQLYKFMDDRGTPINNCPMIGTEDIDLYRLFRVVYKIGGYNRVTNQNQWKSITRRIGLSIQLNPSTHNLVKQAYKKFLHSFEDFYRKLGCTMVNHPRGSTRKQRPGRSLIRDKDRNTPVPPILQKTDFNSKEKESEDEKKPDDDKKCLIVESPDDDSKIKKKDDEISGGESDVNIEAESTADSSSSEKSVKPSRLTPVSRAKVIIKPKDDPKKKTHDKKKDNASSGSSTSSQSSTGVPGLKKKDDESTKTRSKSKEEPKKDGKIQDNSFKMSRETRETSRESEKTRNSKRRMTDDDLKKQRGRKKRDDDKSRDKDDNSGAESSAPSYKGPIQLGDRLKVYYGPNHESKVTYEAKVIGIQRIDEDAELDYLVHYTGWNTRYDEWIKASRIAQNFTQTQGRVKRTKATPRPQTPSANSSVKGSKTLGLPGRRRAQSVAPSGTKTSSSGSSGGLSSSSSTGKDKEPIRSTTPLSVASSSSRTKSPATPASRPTRNASRNAELGVELRRRTRRTSGHTDLSVATESEDSDAYETDNTEPERARTRSRGTEERRRREVRRRVEDRIKPDENSEVDEDKGADEVPRRTRRLRRSVKKIEESKSEGSVFADETDDPDDNDDDVDDVNEDLGGDEVEKGSEEMPKGRDFDLNQIRSELKGFDKAVKLEVMRMEPEGSGDDEVRVKVEGVDEGLLEVEIKKEVDVKGEADEVIKVVEADTEDVYEFKEPEPFEFEVRGKRDCGEKDKGGVKKRVFDEEPKSPKKKQKIGGFKDVSSPIASAGSPGDGESKKKIKKSIKATEEESENVVKSSLKEFDKSLEIKSISLPEELKSCNSDVLFLDIPGVEGTTGDVDDADDKLVTLENEGGDKLVEEVEKVEKIDIKIEIKDEDNSSSTSSGISSNLSATSAVERRIMDAKIPSTIILTPTTPIVPVPISARLPATSTIEEKLSAAALAFRQQKPKDLKIHDDDVKRKDNIKKIELKRGKFTPESLEIIKKDSDNVIKLKDDDDKNKKEDLQKNDRRNIEKRQIDPLKEILESTEIDKQKRKKILSQEFLDSTDSSDSEQKLIIDNFDDKMIKIEKTEVFDKKNKENNDILDENLSIIVVKNEEETENMNLLCEEEIPGSPAPQLDNPDDADDSKDNDKIVILEMPFASAPTSGQSSQPGPMTPGVSCGVPAGIGHQVVIGVRPVVPVQVQEVINNVQMVQMVQNRRESDDAAPVMDNTPPTTPDSTISNVSESPRGDDRPGTPISDDTKSRGDGDNDEAKIVGFDGIHEGAGGDGGPGGGESGKCGVKRPVEDPSSPKKRKRSRKSSEGSKDKRGRGRTTRQGAGGSDSDDTSEGSNAGGNLADAGACEGVGREGRGLKYNFFVDLDPELDGCQRIAVLQQKLTELKKTYNIVKSELAAIERRRKKLRRREREAKKLSIAAMKAAKAEMQQACA